MILQFFRPTSFGEKARNGEIEEKFFVLFDILICILRDGNFEFLC